MREAGGDPPACTPTGVGAPGLGACSRRPACAAGSGCQPAPLAVSPERPARHSHSVFPSSPVQHLPLLD